MTGPSRFFPSSTRFPILRLFCYAILIAVCLVPQLPAPSQAVLPTTPAASPERRLQPTQVTATQAPPATADLPWPQRSARAGLPLTLLEIFSSPTSTAAEYATAIHRRTFIHLPAPPPLATIQME